MMAKILLGLNVAGLIVFLVLAFALPLHAQTTARMRFEALESTPTTQRASGDDGVWIAAPAIGAARTAANVGIAVTLLNVALPVVAAVMKQDKKKR